MKEKNILTVGLGSSGEAAIRALVNAGARVSVQDSKSEEEISPELKEYFKENNVKCWFAKTPKDMGAYDMLVLSPGVPPALGFIEEAKAGGAEIIGELELACRLGRGHYVAITGTNGKTTTTTLTGEIFKAAGRESYTVGNIGIPVVSKALTCSVDSWLITETSSFQLETIDTFCPQISAILNITPDHLNRHGNMKNYIDAKARVFMNQTPEMYCVLNMDDEICCALAKRCKAAVVGFSRTEEPVPGAFAKEGRIVIADENGSLTDICGTDELQIPGTHNLENALAAAAISYFAGISPKIIGQVLKTFKGVEHRIELVDTIDGVRYVNDSKGTNPDAAVKAIEAMKENIILIAGGYDKGGSFDEFTDSFGGRVKALLLIGVTAEKIRESAVKSGVENIYMLENMQQCVKKGKELASPGDTVLLSPACASWDMYTSYEKRGEDFKECVAAVRKTEA